MKTKTVKSNDVQRISESVYNTLSELGANMEDYVKIGTREKTEHKLTELETLNPDMFENYHRMNDIHKEDGSKGKVPFIAKDGSKRVMWLAFTLKTAPSEA
jgi:hypothetical protein